MADTRTQQQLSSEQQRGMTRRQEHWPARDAFAFSPFSMMRRLTEEMDRAFSRGSGDWGFTPAIDVRQRDGNIEICAELPGMSKDDVKVECTNEGIILQGEKRREKESDEGGWHRSERSYGSFYRMIPLPARRRRKPSSKTECSISKCPSGSRRGRAGRSRSKAQSNRAAAGTDVCEILSA
jgi:HSP20 family protein